ncbi:hypothetical protein VKT23_015365 [Stygiomarasmius scandens]|uniref:Uncharacterized protein n=1 Tax=Marasmiellus scandens TaxID=2682957 RepID=A0ABR1J1E2_9AGAR
MMQETTKINQSLPLRYESAPQRKPTAPLPSPEPVEEVDFLGSFGDDAFGAPTPAPPQNTNKALPAVGGAPSNQDVLDGSAFDTRSQHDYYQHCSSRWTEDEPDGNAQFDAGSYEVAEYGYGRYAAYGNARFYEWDR